VICSTEYEQSDSESTRRSFQSVRSYEEINGAFDSKCGRRLQRPVSTTVNGECSTSHLRQRPYISLDGRDRNGDRHRNTSTTVEVVWRQKSTTKLRSRSAACIRSLAKLSLATFSVTEPANWLLRCLLIDRLYNLLYYRKYWKVVK